MVSIVEDVYEESEVPDIVDEVERRNEERIDRGRRARFEKRDEEGILNCSFSSRMYVCILVRVEEEIDEDIDVESSSIRSYGKDRK